MFKSTGFCTPSLVTACLLPMEAKPPINRDHLKKKKKSALSSEIRKIL